MGDPQKIEGAIRNLRRYTGYLHQLGAIGEEELLADPIKIGAARYYLQVAIECCIDVANHIISTERLRAPQDYRDTFKVLNEASVIPDDFAQTLQVMASFRNRLVHMYWEVDDRRVYNSLTHDLDDFDTYVSHILAFLSDTS